MGDGASGQAMIAFGQAYQNSLGPADCSAYIVNDALDQIFPGRRTAIPRLDSP